MAGRSEPGAWSLFGGLWVVYGGWDSAYALMPSIQAIETLSRRPTGRVRARVETARLFWGVNPIGMAQETGRYHVLPNYVYKSAGCSPGVTFAKVGRPKLGLWPELLFFLWRESPAKGGGRGDASVSRCGTRICKPECERPIGVLGVMRGS